MLKQKNKKIIIVGYKSFIQSNLFNNLKNKFNVKKLRFHQINKKNISDCDVIINCSNSKDFFYKKYNIKNDRNLKIAKLIQNKKIKLFLLSSRQVYLQKLYIDEKSKLKPISVYAENCLITEKQCRKYLKKNLLILRLSNVFGFENKNKKKPSLVSYILKGIERKEIKFDNNFLLYKDFLPIDLLCMYIEKLININAEGIVNVGSGFPFLVKDFVKEIVNLKKIRLIVKISNKFSDKSYCFNIQKINKLTGIKINKKILLDGLQKLKNKLN